VTSLPSDGAAARGIVRLHKHGRRAVLCLAGEVDRGVIDFFLRRYGPELARVDGIDAGSVTSRSAPTLQLRNARPSMV
jgi:hypothetical protein